MNFEELIQKIKSDHERKFSLHERDFLHFKPTEFISYLASNAHSELVI